MDDRDETKEMVPMMNGFDDQSWVMWLVMGGVLAALWALVVLAAVALVRTRPPADGQAPVHNPAARP